MAYSAVSEGPLKITKATVDGAWKRRAANVRLLVKDAECRGLVLVVNSTSMTWRYDYRPRGLDTGTGKRWAGGAPSPSANPATHSPDDARTAANKVKGQAAAGGDPAAERRAAAEAERRRRAMTLGRLLDEYTKVLPTRPKLRGAGLPCARHAREDVARARAAVDAMGASGKPVAELAPADVRRMLGQHAGPPERGPRPLWQPVPLSRLVPGGRAHRNQPVRVGGQGTPAEGNARPGAFPVPGGLGKALAAGRTSWRIRCTADLARFLIAVPCRRGEAAALDWTHLDFGGADWRQPGKLTKNGEAHRLHLHPLALDLLRRRWTAAGEPKAGLVFPSPEAGKRIQTFSDFKGTLDDKAELTGWRWHDFRRSFATALAEAGTPEAVADAVLNHRQSGTRGGVLGVYQRASRWPEQVMAMQAWGRLLAGTLAPKPGKATPEPEGHRVRRGHSDRRGAKVVVLAGSRGRAG